MTYPAAQTYWLNPTDQTAVGLRRYASRGDDRPDCPLGELSYHNATTMINVAPIHREAHESAGRVTWSRPEFTYPDHDDPRWPAACACGYVFAAADHWQDWSDPLYERTDTGARTTLRDAAPGASWDAFWMPDSNRRADGISLMVKLPNGHDWAVDSEASNCTRKGEPHECWVRHGDPRLCHVTVDKNGDTCAAGAGSILATDYHGFLVNGVLSEG